MKVRRKKKCCVPFKTLCEKQYLTNQNELIKCSRLATYKQYNTFQGVWIYRCGLHKYKKSLWTKINQEDKNG
ncbi:MAG: hypothetical protein A2W23_06515 [Planctomycetes bacterium RBG_16_43_13]|nr:MAG: hypothetical protein A2W23_06515 [Planctomycetes bacterium RBG_16_43_13]